jgi:branched-chain amino acid transport system permease protein
LLIGAVYAVVAGGLTLIFGIMNIINLAHGDFLMLAMYATFFLFVLFGIDPFLAIFFVFPLSFVIGIAVYQVLIKRVAFAMPVNQVLVTFGLSLIIQNAALAVFSPNYRSIDLPYGQNTVVLGNLIVGVPQLLGFVLATSLCLSFYWVLKSTDLGRSIRAVSQNREAALLMGINVNRVAMIAFGCGIGLLGIAGPVVASYLYIAPSVGNIFLMTAFVVVVMGGLGSFLGALVSGFVVGVIESVASVLIQASFAPAVTMAVFIIVLMFRPEGLFGGSK